MFCSMALLEYVTSLFSPEFPMSHREVAPLEPNVPPGFTSWAIAAPPLCENRCQYGPDNLCWRQSVLSTLLEQRLDRFPSSLNHSLRDGLFSDKIGDYSTHGRDLHQFGLPEDVFSRLPTRD